MKKISLLFLGLMASPLCAMESGGASIKKIENHTKKYVALRIFCTPVRQEEIAIIRADLEPESEITFSDRSSLKFNAIINAEIGEVEQITRNVILFPNTRITITKQDGIVLDRIRSSDERHPHKERAVHKM